MLVGVSTGVLYKSVNGIGQQIDFFRKSGVDIDGIEVSFPSADMLDGLAISKDNEKYLRQLKFTSMHLPWKNIEYSGKETPEIQYMADLYRRLNCRVAVIHPDCVKDLKAYETLQKLFPGLSVENMTRGKSFGHRIDDIKTITDRYATIGVVLDFAHCMDTSEPFEAYEKAFYPKITEIHISALKESYESEKDSRHIVLHKTGINPRIKKKGIPFIIEGKLSTIEELEKEINFLKLL